VILASTFCDDAIVQQKQILLGSGRLLQVGALVYRFDESGLKFLLITSRGTGRWIIPKGWPMPGRTLAQAALREAQEEAGVCGQVFVPSFGRYDYEKGDMPSGVNNCFTVEVYAVLYVRQKKKWRERDQRSLAWLAPDAARDHVREKGLKKILENFCPMA